MAALYTHGAPARMGLLAAVLEEQERQETRDIYVGDVLCATIRLKTSGDVDFPFLSELMRENRVRDDRTAEDIIADLVKMLEK